MLSDESDLLRMRDGVRRISQMSEICGMEGDVISTNDIAMFEFEGEDGKGIIKGHYSSPRIRPGFIEKLRYFGFDRAWMEALSEIDP